jgi:hypothetical protein
MIEAKQTHCGQYKPYGDFFRVWNIQTDLPKEDVVKWCFENLYKRILPSAGEFRLNICYGAPKWNDPGYYFAGYYSIKEIEGGFEFSVCEPFAD